MGYQIHELWCLGLDNITSKVHPTYQLDVGDGTMEEFMTNYLAENGRIILIIGQPSINRSVQFLGITNFSGEVDCCLLKTCKLPLFPLAGDMVITTPELGSYPGGTLQYVEYFLGYYHTCPFGLNA